MIQKLLVVAGILCGLIAFVIVAFGNGHFDTAIEFAGAGIVALGAAMLV
jgi:hypothetical protein